MSDTQKAALERLRRDQQRYADVDLVARAVGNAERGSYARSELAQTSASGLAKRHDIASRLGQTMQHTAVDFFRSVTADVRSEEELLIAMRYAKDFNAVSEQAYREYLMDHMWEER